MGRLSQETELLHNNRLIAIALSFALVGLLTLALWYFMPKEVSDPLPLVTVTGPVPMEAPSFQGRGGYMTGRDGLFRPEEPLTMGEAASIVKSESGQDVLLAGDEPCTYSALETALKKAFSAAEIAGAMELCRKVADEPITRAEAAVIFNRLFRIAPSGERSVYPDVEEGYWAEGDIAAAENADGTAEHEPGFFLLDGYLYSLGEDGKLLKNDYIGSLYFDNTGRYTSGSRELDDYVAKAIRENTTEDMTREEMLRAMYVYIRDNFTYLKRNYYKVGDLGWSLQEALTMYSTGRGNCYCYASAFWAAARNLGYQAKPVSGTYGVEQAPHGWVEIWQDGVRYTYDVEIEMVAYSKGLKATTLYAMTDAARIPHCYVELALTDDVVPRGTNAGLLPR